MNDQIVIRGLELRTRIGVPAEERAEPQLLLAHLTLETSSFPLRDTLDGTVDYKAVVDAVCASAETGERKLIESLAQDIAHLVLASFPVKRIKVELEKFILPETKWVGVVIERESTSIGV